MARPQKEGLDYFPLDVEMDDKVKLIDAKFGVAGFGVLIKLWQIIYDNGYYIKWTEKELLLYKNRINADINLINDIINECLKWNIFDSRIYNSYFILTSAGIQKRYLEAVKRRNETVLISELLLTGIPDKFKPIIKKIPISVIVSNNSKNVDNNTQRKVKKSKVKNIYIKTQHLSMTKDEYEKLVELYGKSIVDSKIEYAENYAKLKNYKSLYLTLNNWLKADVESQPKSQYPDLTNYKPKE
jgi:hypothetical protein